MTVELDCDLISLNHRIGPLPNLLRVKPWLSAKIDLSRTLVNYTFLSEEILRSLCLPSFVSS